MDESLSRIEADAPLRACRAERGTAHVASLTIAAACLGSTLPARDIHLHRSDPGPRPGATFWGHPPDAKKNP